MNTLAVLVSGGLDSAILLAESLPKCPRVFPLFVREGLAWEEEELRHLRRFLDAVRCPSSQPLHILQMPVADLYRDHWSITGRAVPGADTPDEAVFLPGRFDTYAAVSQRLHQVLTSFTPLLPFSKIIGESTQKLVEAIQKEV